MPAHTVVVGVACPVGPRNLARIAAVSDRVRVVDIASPLYQIFPPTAAPGLPPPPPYTGTESLPDLCRNVEVLLARAMPPGFLEIFPALRWVQGASAGMAHWLATGLPTRADIALTSAAGFNAVPVAEWALTAMLVLTKQVPRLLQRQRDHVWQRTNALEELCGKTVGIVGLGAIGSRLAFLCHSLGMNVLGVRRRAGEPVPYVDEVLPPERLGDLLERSDVVVLAAPLTEQTHGMIDAAALRRMRPQALLVNVARGGLVDEAALTQALREGTIVGAALDVVAHEPLPPESLLWDLPNVLLSSHIAGLSVSYDTGVTDLFVANLTRYLVGQPLLNLVDPAQGY